MTPFAAMHVVIDDGMIHFAVYTAADSQCFVVSWTTPKIVPSRGGISNPSNTWFSQPTRVRPHKPHLDRFIYYCRARERDQQTDRQTDRPRYSVFRPHLAIAAMWHKNVAIPENIPLPQTDGRSSD